MGQSRDKQLMTSIAKGRKKKTELAIKRGCHRWKKIFAQNNKNM